MISNVVINGKMSSDIHVNRSVRQGSIVGSWYYMLFIHELATSLLKSKSGAHSGQVSSCAVLQADAKTLVALTVHFRN